MLLGGSSDTPNRSLKSGRNAGNVGGHTAASNTTHSRSGGTSRDWHSRQTFLRWWWSLNGQRDDVPAAQQDKPEDALLLSFWQFRVLRLDLTELLAVPQDEVHVFVERLERSDEGPRILQDNPHPIVQELDHLVVLADRHFGWIFQQSPLREEFIPTILIF